MVPYIKIDELMCINFEDPNDLEFIQIDSYKMTNRERSQYANKAKFWCGRCDAALTNEVKRCPNCGWTFKHKKFVKDIYYIE
jgi:uncharacterized CHY-type Zn-finger protein